MKSNTILKIEQYYLIKGKVFILLAILLLLSNSIFSQNEKLQKITFVPMWFPQPQFAGYYMAKEKGIYEKYGLDVNIINGGYSKNVFSMLKNSEVDLGILYLSGAIKQRANGNKLVNIAQLFQHSEILFVSKKTSGINSLKDFNGKKIAIWRTILTELTEGFLKKHNIVAEVIKINGGVNIFLKDAVDICAVMNYNEYNSLINYGLNPDELDVFPFKDYGMDFPEDGIYCMEKAFNENPTLYKNFVAASLEGWKYALSNSDEALMVLQKYQKIAKVQISKTHAEWMLKSMKYLVLPNDKNVNIGSLLETDFNNTVDFLFENQIIGNRPSFTDFYKGSN